MPGDVKPSVNGFCSPSRLQHLPPTLHTSSAPMISTLRQPETEAEYARYLQQKIAEIQQRNLVPLKEDVADWLNATLGIEDVTADNYMWLLDNGVTLCQLASVISSRAAQLAPHSENSDEQLSFTFRFWRTAARRTFFARDNVFNFVQFCRRAGCREHFLFETDDLVLHAQPRAVLLCLLELGRRCSRYVEPPCLVQLEHEIDQQLLTAAGSAEDDSVDAVSGGATAGVAPFCRDGSDSGYSDCHERERSGRLTPPVTPPVTPPITPPPLQQSHLLSSAQQTPVRKTSYAHVDSDVRATASARASISLIPVSLRRQCFRKAGSLSVPASTPGSPMHHRSVFSLAFSGRSTPDGCRTPCRIPRALPSSMTSLANTAPHVFTRTRSVMGDDISKGVARRLRGLSMASQPGSPAGHKRLTSQVSAPNERLRPATASARLKSARTPLSRTPSNASLNSTVATQTSALDEKVRQTVASTQICCSCVSGCRQQPLQLRRLSEGQYLVAGRVVFIRLLKGRHVMVRVGGGWDTLEHFLTRHDACRPSRTLPESLVPSVDGASGGIMLRLPATPRHREVMSALVDQPTHATR